MLNYKLKFVKSAAALALGVSVITSAVVADTTASAKTTYKVSNGKLVNAKTKKAIKGYKSYKSVIYKDGKKFTGLYSNRYYKTGVKATGTYKNTYYVKGVKKVGTGTYAGAYYVKGVKKVTTGSYNKAYYEKGKKVVATGLYQSKYYVDGVLNVGSALFEGKLYDGSELNKGLKEFNGKTYFDADLANDTYKDANGVEKAYENGIEVGAKVKSVEAINGTTFVVNFNKAVDKTDAEAATVTVGSINLSSGKLSDNGRTLTFTTTTAIDVEDATVTVPSIKTKADAKVSTPKYVQVLTYKDTVAPTALSASSELATITSTKADSVVVKFSEAVQNTGIFYVNGTSVTATQPGAKDELVLNVDSLNLKAGDALDVKLTNVKDIAGNNISPNPVTVNTTVVAADAVAPVIESVTTKDDNKVVVTYNKDIDTTTATELQTAYLSVAGVKQGNATAVTIDKNKVTYTFAPVTLVDNKATATLYVPKASVKDTKGNELAADYSTSVSFEKDVTAPTVTNSNFKDGKLTLDLSEEVALGSGTTVTLTKVNTATGNTTPAGTITLLPTNISTDGKTLTVDTASLNLPEGSYKVNFADKFVKDTSNAQNEAKAYETSIDVPAATAAEDKDAPVVTSLLASADTANTLTFTITDALNNLDFASILDKNNYTFAGKALPAGSTITTTAQTTDVKTTAVTVTIPKTAFAKETAGVFTVTGLKDIKGNALSKIEQSGSVTFADGVAPTVNAATAYKADNTLLVTLSEDIDVAKLDKADFLVSVNGGAATAAVSSIAKATGADAGVGNYILTLNPGTLDASTTTKVQLSTIAAPVSTDNATNPLTAVTTALSAVIK